MFDWKRVRYLNKIGIYSNVKFVFERIIVSEIRYWNYFW